MPFTRHCSVQPLAATVVVLWVTLGVGTAHASCSAFATSANLAYRGAIGAANRPFAGPGDKVMLRELSCPDPPDGFAGIVGPDDFLVTLVFKPPDAALASLLVLTNAGSCSDVDPELPADGELSGLGLRRAKCLKNSVLGVETKDDVRYLTFVFPDTRGWLGLERNLSGPVVVAVTKPALDFIPENLGKKRCAEGDSGAKPVICVDQLFVDDPACDTEKKSIRSTLSHFTALPLENSFRKQCDEDSGIDPKCDADPDELRFAVDAQGTAFVPMLWEGIMRPKPKPPAKGPKFDRRRVIGRTAVRASSDGGGRVHIPSASFLSARTRDGKPFPTTFRPAKGSKRELALEGDADELQSVLVIERRKPWNSFCDGGPNLNLLCGGDGDCPNASCEEKEGEQKKLFFCQGGNHPDRPCTSSAQCKGGGDCVAGSTCRKPFDAGDPEDPDGPKAPPTCKTDAECTNSGEECGPGLFEYRDQMADSEGPVVIGHNASGDKERGACRGGLFKGWSCVLGCPGSLCVGYRLEARGHNLPLD